MYSLVKVDRFVRDGKLMIWGSRWVEVNCVSRSSNAKADEVSYSHSYYLASGCRNKSRLLEKLSWLVRNQEYIATILKLSVIYPCGNLCHLESFGARRNAAYGYSFSGRVNLILKIKLPSTSVILKFCMVFKAFVKNLILKKCYVLKPGSNTSGASWKNMLG